MISEFSFLGIRLKTQTQTQKSQQTFVFGSKKFTCMWICILITVSTFLRVKTDKTKNRLNSINLQGSEALKRQTYSAWLAMWLNHFVSDVIWTAFQLFLKLHSYIFVSWCLCRISVISEVFLSIGLETKTRKSRSIFTFQFVFSNFSRYTFLYLFLYF